jgi:polygalacturonase
MKPANQPDTTRRRALQLAGAAALGATFRLRAQQHTFDVRDYGAKGDGVSLDTVAIQKAIDAAAASGGQVLLRGGRKYLVSTLVLRSGIDFHLADDAELLASTNRADYPGEGDGILTAQNATGLKITGTGNINGRAKEFMTGYNQAGEIWRFGPFRPKIFVLTGCKNLEVRDISFSDAPFWGLHMIGCEHVLVDHLRVRNLLDVPNCDGIDPDHCRDVEIRNCDIVCGDDAIVVKSTRQTSDYGPCSNILVHDCVMTTKDSGLKIGTETTQEISHVRFERCEIRSSCRGLTIQLRDEGNVSDIQFNDIKFVSQYQAAPWWGRGEAISLTAIPRSKDTKVGKITNVHFRNISGRAENSARVSGSPKNRISEVTFENVDLTLDRWTAYPGPIFDNRPTSAIPDLEAHRTPGFSIRNADHVSLKNCSVTWGKNCPEYFTHAFEAENVSDLAMTHFGGDAAHPERDDSIVVR